MALISLHRPLHSKARYVHYIKASKDGAYAVLYMFELTDERHWMSDRSEVLAPITGQSDSPDTADLGLRAYAWAVTNN